VSFAATFLLVFLLIVRPQEIWPSLEALHLLDVATGIAAVGVLIDFARRRHEHPYSPQLPFLGAFVATSYFCTVLLVGQAGVAIATQRALLAAIFMLVVMYGARSVPRIIALVALLATLAVFVSAVAIHQAHVEPVCIALPDEDDPAVEDGEPDGRSCTTAMSCREGGRAEVDYACERIGLFQTVSTGRRPRWRGQLNDPNELSVFLGAVVPLLLALGVQAKRKLLSIATLGIVAMWLYTIFLTQSRGGQVVVAAVLGTYFVSRLGVKGLIGGGVLALPVLLYGGRAGAEADASSQDRLELLYQGMTLFSRHPVLGVGTDQFLEHSTLHQTAHNSYLLTGAELGFPGLVLWTGLLWASVKIPLTAMGRAPLKKLRPLSMALVASFVGVATGIFFLSFTYKQLLFVWFGLAGAFYGVVREEDPECEVKIGFKDCLGIVLFDVVVIAGIYLYSRAKG
jgi:O-antigen ligase